jgi:hypothetical protein
MRQAYLANCDQNVIGKTEISYGFGYVLVVSFSKQEYHAGSGMR